MNTSTSTNTKGFTIIEVVLVLAIAGLIFLLVFLAVPALQRSQRDTQRRNDVGRLMSQVQTFASNNRGRVPTTAEATATTATSFRDRYLMANNDSFNDPTTGNTYVIAAAPSPYAAPAQGTIHYAPNSTCSGNESAPFTAVTGGSATNPRRAAAAIALEGGGIYCQNN